MSEAPLTKGMLVDRARGMRKQSSRAEAVLWSLLRKRQVGSAQFRRQHPILNYIADFACVEAKLIVEVDGRSHDNAEQETYDSVRTEALVQEGWRVLRVRDDDLLTDSAKVVASIASELLTT